LTLFRLLAAAGQLDSITLLRALPEARTTPHLASLLTNQLKHRSKALGLRPPWRATRSPGRVTWVDSDGDAGRMVRALEEEERARQLPPPPALPPVPAAIDAGVTRPGLDLHRPSARRHRG